MPTYTVNPYSGVFTVQYENDTRKEMVLGTIEEIAMIAVYSAKSIKCFHRVVHFKVQKLSKKEFYEILNSFNVNKEVVAKLKTVY